MGSALVYVVVVALVAGAVFLLVSLVFGRGEELAPMPPTATPTRLPARDLSAADVRDLRFQQALRGYKCSEVDWAIERLAAEVEALRARLEAPTADPVADPVADPGTDAAQDAAQDADQDPAQHPVPAPGMHAAVHPGVHDDLTDPAPTDPTVAGRVAGPTGRERDRGESWWPWRGSSGAAASSERS